MKNALQEPIVGRGHLEDVAERSSIQWAGREGVELEAVAAAGFSTDGEFLKSLGSVSENVNPTQFAIDSYSQLTFQEKKLEQQVRGQMNS